jgi:glycosyltransferase involved in cell wall biosynthesis
MKKIVWLTSWYPNRDAPLDGDFIERHAAAAAQHHSIYIIYVHKKINNRQGGVQKVVNPYSERLTAAIYYYPGFSALGKWIEVLVSNIDYVRLHYRALKEYKKIHGRPDGIHVFVGIKAGIPALLWKWLYKIPYIVFERWSAFLPEAKPSFSGQPWMVRKLWAYIFRQSRHLNATSQHMARVLAQYNRPVTVIPNGINDSLFFPIQKTGNAVFRFIHVSILNYQKNAEQMLEAFRMLLATGQQAELHIYGPPRPHLVRQVQEWGIGKSVLFFEETTHAGIARAMQQADALVLFSRYETFGNVLTEANACGIPVVVSDYATFEEIIENGKTGITAKSEDPADLAVKMKWLIDHYNSFDPAYIAARTKVMFNQSAIASIFDKMYREVL